MDDTVHGILQARILEPRNTGVSSLSLLQGNLPYPGAERGSPALQVDSIPAELSLTVLGPCCCVGFSPVVVVGGLLSSCGVFSCCRAWALEHRLSSCGSQP